MTAPVARIRLREPLRARAGGEREQDVAGETLGALLSELERRHPGVRGWILDERGRIRRHINVYVNGEQGSEDTPVAAGDRVDVLPAISGG